MPAEFQIVVKLDPRDVVQGTKVVEGQLRRTNSAALELNRTLRSVFGFYAIKEAITFVYNLAEGYTKLSNQLRNVSNSQNNLSTQMRETYRIAQLTRTDWEATNTIYARLARSQKSLGVSQRELLDFTESLNKQIRVTGPTSMEAKAGLLQLSQGMSSGRLAGEELRAVLEQLPTVAQTIAKGMGVPIGRLRDLAREGKITPKIILDAFKKDAPNIQKEFDKLTPTMGEGFVVVKNALTKFVGEMAQSSGIATGFANALIFVGKHMEIVGSIVLTLVHLLAIQLARVAIGAVLTGLRMLGAAAVANPFTALMFVIVTIVLALRQFGDQLETSRQIMTKTGAVAVTIGDNLRALWTAVKELGSAIFDFLSTAWNALTDAFGSGLDSGGIINSFSDVLKFTAGFVGAMKQLFLILKEDGIAIFGALAIAIVGQIVDALNKVIGAFEDALNFLRQGLFDFMNKTDQKKSEAHTAASQSYIAKLPKIYGAMDDEARRTTGYDDKAYYNGSQGSFEEWKREQSRKKALYEADLKRRLDQTKQDELVYEYEKRGLDPQGRDFRAGKHELGRIDDSLGGWRDQAKSYLEDSGELIASGFMKGVREFEERSAQSAIERAKRSPNELQGDPGAGDPGEANKKAISEWNKLLRQLDALMKKSSPITKAEMELAAAEKLLAMPKILEELERRGVTAATVLSDFREQINENLDPLGTFVTKTIEASAAMSGSVEQHELEEALLKTINDLTEKGVTLKIYEEQQLRRVIAAQQERARVWAIEQKVLESIQGPLKEYHRTLSAIANLEKRGDITGFQADFARRKAQSSYLSGNDDAYADWRQRAEGPMSPFEKGMHQGFQNAGKSIEEMVNLSKVVEDAWVGAFTRIEEAILKAVETGKFEMEDWTQAIIAMLNRVALKIVEMKLIQFLMSLGSGGGSSGAAIIGGVLQNGGVTSPSGMGGAGPSYGSSARMAPSGPVPFAGASAPAGASARRSSGASGPVIINNVFDKSTMVRGMRTAEGRREIVNIVTEELGGTGLLERKR